MPAVTGTITRTELSLSALGISDGTSGISLSLNGLDPGRRAWRRETVASRYVQGEVETSAVLDQVHDTVLNFRVKGTSPADVKTKVGTLLDAVEQSAWTLAVVVGTGGTSATWSFVCTRSDSVIGFTVPMLRSFVAPVTVFTTRSPSSGY